MKKFNITYSSFLLALCVLTMAVEDYFNTYLIYFFYLFVFANIFFGIKPNLGLLKRFRFFWLPVAFFLFWVILEIPELKESKIVIGDAFNIIWWVIFMIMLDFSLKDINDYRKFEYNTHLLCFLFIIVAAIIGGYKFNAILHGNFNKSFYTSDGQLINGTSLGPDYNVFSTALILGVISGKYILDKTKKKGYRFLIIISQIFILSIVFLSSSRRGVLFIFLALLILITFSFKNKIDRYQLKNRIIRNIFSLVLPFIMLLILFSNRLNSIFNNERSQEIITRIGTISNEKQVTSDRTLRWEYANDLISEYSWPQLLLGDGFNYLKKYSKRFHTPLGSDYPHNFFYSTMLYSGITGVLLMFFLIIRIGIAYIRQFSIFSSFTFWFIILFLFSVTSANTWFSLRLNIILTLLPFLAFSKRKKNLEKEITR